MTKLIPNYLIDSHLLLRKPFVNYNGSIVATLDESGDIYRVVHWNTVIIEYNVKTEQVVYFRSDYISQTTSRLVGRIVRNLIASSALDEYLERNANPEDTRRLHRMASHA